MDDTAENGEPSIVRDYAGRPVQLRAVLALWDTSAAMMWDRLEGLTPEEWTWDPGPWPQLRPLSWSAHHLGELGLLRADWTTGERRLGRADAPMPATMEEGLAFLHRGLDAWRTTLEEVDDDLLDTVGGSQFPDGLDPHLPLIDIVWWNTRELIHHASDMATMRDLYAARTAH